jgi:hypothetical protein
MVLGVLCVFLASSLQQEIGMLNDPTSLRLWMSRGWVDLHGHKYRNSYGLLPLESSIWALKRSSLPKAVLNVAVLLYIVGFGLYLLFSWLYHADPNGGRDDFRNILITFVICVGTLIMYLIALQTFRALDFQKKDKDFRLKKSWEMGFEKPDSQQDLDHWLEKLRDLQTTVATRDRPGYDALTKDIEGLIERWTKV